MVLEAPAAGISVGWAWVQDDLARTTRVCSYDRAGLGWSEAGEGGYQAARVPDQLHTLLERAGERGPFVIAGHELGAAFARMYAARFRAETAALVLVDDPSEAPESTPRLVRMHGHGWRAWDCCAPRVRCRAVPPGFPTRRAGQRARS